MKEDMRVMYRKSVTFFAAAAMAAALLGGQAAPVAVSYAAASEEEEKSLFPDNVTIEEPTALYNIELPENDYGTLSWANDSQVPEERVVTYKAELKPFDGVDLTWHPDWDEEDGVVKGKITVVVSSLGNENNYEEENEDSQPPVTETPTVTAAPSVPEVPEPSVTPEPLVTVIPDVTETPSQTETPSVSPNPSVTVMPEASVTPLPEEGTVPPSETPAAPTETPVPTEDGEGMPPEVTTAPVLPDTEETPVVPSETPAVPETPEGAPTEIPSAQPTEIPVSPEEEIPAEDVPAEEIPVPTQIPENIFDNPADTELPDSRPATAEDTLSEEEKAARAAENHSCNGISVSGIELPWYVQFRVSSGAEYQFTNEEDAAIFKSYEFELWDLKNNTEYQIPDGEYISVTVPVKEGYTYSIEHLLDNGAMETILPSVDGSTMVFSTHSFSPFGIAGSKPIIGGDIAEDGYAEPTGTPAAVKKPTSTPKPAGQTSGNTGNTASGSSVSPNTGSTTGQTSGQTATVGQNQGTNNTGSSSTNTVNTGDTTQILPFILLVAAAAGIIVVVVIIKKKKK